jgi:hypothetical protein
MLYMCPCSTNLNLPSLLPLTLLPSAVYRDKIDAWTNYMQQNYPELLQPQNKGTAQRQMVDASMDAFAALERQLEQQQQRQQQQQAQQQQAGEQMDTD